MVNVLKGIFAKQKNFLFLNKGDYTMLNDYLEHNETQWLLPNALLFDTDLEDTEVAHKKKLVKIQHDGTRQVADIVGYMQGTIPHHEVFGQIITALKNQLAPVDFQSADVKWTSCHNDLYAVMDIRFPTIKAIFQENYEYSWWEKSLRLIVVRSINGSCSTNAFFGDIDWFCLNTLISGDFQSVTQRNTTNFSAAGFAVKIPDMKTMFLEKIETEKKMLETPTNHLYLKELFHSFWPNCKTQEGKIRRNYKLTEFTELYNYEAEERGDNVYAALSAFSRYGAHKNLKEPRTRHWNTAAKRDHLRELEVKKYLESDAWNNFLSSHNIIN